MRRTLTITLCLLPPLLFSCATTKNKPTPTESRATYKGLKLGRPTPVRGSVEPASVFVTSDEAVVALVELEDLRGEIEVRWDWIAPDDKPYVSARRKVGPADGKYYPKAAVLHALNVDREQASAKPGLWTVEVSVDSKLKESKKFNLEPGLTTLMAPVTAPDPKKWALVVGIQNYLHLPPVDFAAQDAKTVSNYFVNLLGVPEGNVVLLTNETATQGAFTARLKDYLPKNLDPDSTLYVYFAGHGMPDVGSGTPYLALYDSEATNIARTGYGIKEYLADLGSLPAKRVFVFTDACFSGQAARGEKMLVAGARPAMVLVEDVNIAAGKVVAFGATTGSQLSHAYREKRQGLFTFFVLSGLSGKADGNGDGVVTVGELYPYVKENVERVSKRTAMEQVPALTPRLENVADVNVAGSSKN